MTTEDALHAILDANPDDWQTRLILADWHQDYGDPRAEGYRAMGQLRVVFRQRTHFWVGNDDHPVLQSIRHMPSWEHYGSLVPEDWFKAIDSGTPRHKAWRRFDTRRACEDAVAIAFAKLPPERRAQLLNAEPVTA